jgi:hypothetical protein
VRRSKNSLLSYSGVIHDDSNVIVGTTPLAPSQYNSKQLDCWYVNYDCHENRKIGKRRSHTHLPQINREKEKKHEHNKMNDEAWT